MNYVLASYLYMIFNRRRLSTSARSASKKHRDSNMFSPQKYQDNRLKYVGFAFNRTKSKMTWIRDCHPLLLLLVFIGWNCVMLYEKVDIDVFLCEANYGAMDRPYRSKPDCYCGYNNTLINLVNLHIKILPHCGHGFLRFK